MTERTLEGILWNLLVGIIESEEGDEIGDSDDIRDDFKDLADVNNFSGCGLMTEDAGLVIRTKDGSEFQITIVQSR